MDHVNRKLYCYSATIISARPAPWQVGKVITVASRSGQSTRHMTSHYTLVVKHCFVGLPANKNVQMDRKVHDFAEET